jgi:hypothetical protein
MEEGVDQFTGAAERSLGAFGGGLAARRSILGVAFFQLIVARDDVGQALLSRLERLHVLFHRPSGGAQGYVGTFAFIIFAAAAFREQESRARVLADHGQLQRVAGARRGRQDHAGSGIGNAYEVSAVVVGREDLALHLLAVGDLR